ncbi:stage III sporulation protein AH [Mobilisporobacter senegalensis]|uniref:Stage III sporulation protein AH n=1 Tax=Mobilisporobacter senegalensis TaxID=1329262 RepID=A0A3N1XK73_9FIRM|nr:SpoIIIAH-like family protein [Mobilisporobacter senegalensis]ROR27130.1 stage III sporulation protein AH [Mobilisporobacter senegalensis]
MKNIFRKNQVIITALAIMIAVAGYLNFTNDRVDQEVVSNDLYSQVDDAKEVSGDNTYDFTEEDLLLDLSEEDIAEAEKTKDAISKEDAIDVTDSGELATEETKETADIKDAEGTPGEAVLASTTISPSYFSSVKIEREQMRSKSKELFMEIVNSDKVSDKQKQAAIDGVIELTSIADKENAAEILLGAQGYENVVVSMSEGKVNVVVSNEGLTEQQIAQIEDATKSATGVKADKIVIKPVVVKAE